MIDKTSLASLLSTTSIRSELGSQSIEGQKMDEAKLQELSREFEAILTAQILESLSLSMADSGADGESSQTHGSTLNGLMWLEMAHQLTSQRDLGLATSLYQQLAPELETHKPQDGPEGHTTPVGNQRSTTPTSVLPTPPPSPPITAPAPLDAPAPAPSWQRPVDGRLSSSFGTRTDPIDGGKRNHRGVDWAAPTGTPVRAASAGTVVFSGPRGGYGNTVVVEHAGGVQTLYAHLSKIDVQQGQQLHAGVEIGKVGQTGRATGPHLHFEVRQGTDWRNPVAWLNRGETPA